VMFSCCVLTSDLFLLCFCCVFVFLSDVQKLKIGKNEIPSFRGAEFRINFVTENLV